MEKVGYILVKPIVMLELFPYMKHGHILINTNESWNSKTAIHFEVWGNSRDDLNTIGNMIPKNLRIVF